MRARSGRRRRRLEGVAAEDSPSCCRTAGTFRPSASSCCSRLKTTAGLVLRETSEAAAAVLAVAVALIDHHQLVDVAERRRDGAEDAARRLEDRRQLLENRLQARRVVELLPRFGLAQDRRGFGDALRFDRLGLRETDRFDLRGFRPALRFDRGGAAGAFLAQLLLLGFGQRDQRRPAAFGFEDRRLLRRPRRGRPPPADRLPPA